MTTQVRNTEDAKTFKKMVDRVDRFMRAVQNEIKDGDLRINAVTKLLEVRRLFDDGQ